MTMSRQPPTKRLLHPTSHSSLLARASLSVHFFVRLYTSQAAFPSPDTIRLSTFSGKVCSQRSHLFGHIFCSQPFENIGPCLQESQKDQFGTKWKPLQIFPGLFQLAFSHPWMHLTQGSPHRPTCSKCAPDRLQTAVVRKQCQQQPGPNLLPSGYVKRSLNKWP